MPNALRDIVREGLFSSCFATTCYVQSLWERGVRAKSSVGAQLEGLGVCLLFTLIVDEGVPFTEQAIPIAANGRALTTQVAVAQS